MTFTCPRCHRQYRTKVPLAGKVIQCPLCAIKLKVMLVVPAKIGPFYNRSTN
ncbi:MAG: hypothetical protein JO112_21785 [Planctomycetes bacterium]|nr:hypothetical protein [Planctomycetota bacterium]